MFITKRRKKQEEAGNTTINNSGVFINKSNVNINYKEQTPEATQAVALKRKGTEEGSTSADGSWNSVELGGAKKYVKVYLSSVYAETDFGGSIDGNQSWLVDDINVSSVLRDYRNEAITGAQMRKILSSSRTLSLSHIFLLSRTFPCVLSRMSPRDGSVIIKSLDVKNNYKSVHGRVVARCHKIQKMLQEEDLDENEYGDILDNMAVRCKNQDEKVAVKIVASLLYRLLNNNSYKEPESNLIIETLRPFILNCIVFETKGIKTEWMTYRMVSEKEQVMIPDFALYCDPLTMIKLELFVVEVKKPGNFSNGHLEVDIVKLGKEMQLALNKLIEKKVKDPEVVALLVEGYKVTTFKMDLQYNGQYRMIELNSFFIVRNNIDDIMLVPSIIEKMYQLKAIIQGTLERLYKAIQGQENAEDRRSYRREACGSPVAVRKEQISELH
ncbi:hypothetical protein HMPREF1544_05082 [Mucor circinelloides 1006PhL]|uniref:Uncharacterized protein n=1 Tax=Mucor circinelloides f. circinelloides (strain 1006PhL) TaxID=1220926 RepID=S2JZ79_MUCC1|nr:hypothetical protein HMPREF1544_05082 [Mucor circinelloides 1006PhL]